MISRIAPRRIARRIGAALAIAPVLALGACRAPSTADITLSLVPYFRDLRIVRVHTGADTLNLLLDTGGGATLIAPEVARAHGCEPHGADVGYRVTGERVVFARCASFPLAAGAWSVTLAPIGVFDVNALLPKELPRLDGVLALDAFREQVITIDWKAATLTIHGAGTIDAALAASGIAFRPATGESGRFLSAMARVDGRQEPLWFLLDTGNLRGTLVADHVVRESLLPLRAAGVAALGVGGRPPIDVPFQAGDFVIDGVLGTDYCQRGPLTLDLRKL